MLGNICYIPVFDKAICSFFLTFCAKLFANLTLFSFCNLSLLIHLYFYLLRTYISIYDIFWFVFRYSVLLKSDLRSFF